MFQLFCNLRVSRDVTKLGLRDGRLEPIRSQINAVSSTEPFQVVDRFHVAKLYRSGLDSLRTQELKRLQQELSEEAYGQFKGTMWALRKSEVTLTDAEKDVLVCLFGHFPCLKMAEEFCKECTAIFDTQMSKREGKRQLWTWMKKVRASQ